MGRKIVRRKVRRKFNKEDKKLRIIDDRIKSDITTIQNAENAFEKEYYKMLLMYPGIFGGTAKEALDKYNKSLVLSPRKSKKGKR